MIEISWKMMPIGPKSGPKSDQNTVGDATCKTVRKTNNFGAVGRRSADPPHLDVVADPAPPKPP